MYRSRRSRAGGATPLIASVALGALLAVLFGAAEWVVLFLKVPATWSANLALTIGWNLLIYALLGCVAGLMSRPAAWLLAAIVPWIGSARGGSTRTHWAVLLAGIVGVYWIVAFNKIHHGGFRDPGALGIDAAIALAAAVLAIALSRSPSQSNRLLRKAPLTAVALLVLWLPTHGATTGRGLERITGGVDLATVQRAQIDKQPSQPPPSVLFIMIDTTRTDALGCYGSEECRTPSIDRLAAESILFEQCVTNEPLTRPAACTMLTGLYPRTHGVDTNTKRLSESFLTLPEALREHGYVTGAFAAASVMSAFYGTDQGFDTYTEPTEFWWEPKPELALGELYDALVPWRDYLVLEIPAREVTRRAVRWIQNNRAGPFFAFVHYFDPHAPYDPPRGFDLAAREGLTGIPEPYENTGDMYAPGFEMPDDFLRMQWLRYLGEVEYMDRHVGELLDAVSEMGLNESTIVVLVADHGEGFEHEFYFGHGSRLYDTLVRVPLVIRAPAAPGPRRVEAQVRLVDIYPTIISLLGLPLDADVQGEEFASWLALSGERGEHRPAFCQTNFGNPLPSRRVSLGVRLPPWKYIESQEIGLTELYDLVQDPDELANLATDLPDIREELAGLLRAWTTSTEHLDVAPPKLSPERLEALRALGYLN